jgi:formyltetrahydrofolate deformylase
MPGMTTPAAAAFVLTLACPDRAGIVHAVTGALAEQGANITEAQQFNDAGTGLFFMRVQFDAPGRVLDALGAALAPLGQRFAASHWALAPAAERMRCAILVSHLGHCLNDLLFRWRSGHLPVDLRAVVSNHRDFEPLVASYGLAFHHIPVEAGNKAGAEARLVQLLDAERIELVVLARYMQILSNDLCTRLAGRAINIHHSFLPSFKGAQPYRQAFERGVKIIGATAHYVTADLDEGPIIEQDIARVDHSHDPTELTAIGRDVECAVLARAVRWHAERRVLIDRTKTVVFR